MAVCLIVGVVIWYTFRVSLLGRWRDIFRIITVAMFIIISPCELNAESSSNLGAPELKFGHDTSYYPQGVRWPGDQVKLALYTTSPPFQVADQPGNSIHEAYFPLSWPHTQELVWNGTAWHAKGWAVKTSPGTETRVDPVEQWSITITPTDGQYQVVANYNGDSATRYVNKTQQFNLVLGSYVPNGVQSVDPDTYVPTTPEEALLHVQIVGDLVSTGGGSGGETDFNPTSPNTTPERDRALDFDIEDGIDYDTETEGDITADPASLIENQTLEDNADARPDLIHIPTLLSENTLTFHVNRVMSELIGDAWTAAAPDSHREKFLQLFQCSTWQDLVLEFETRAEGARSGTFAPLFTGVRLVGTVALSYYIINWFLSLYQSAMGWRMPNILSKDDQGSFSTNPFGGVPEK